jgi:hypothetical protein
MNTQHTPGPWTLIETPHEKIISSWHIRVGEHQIPLHPYKRIWSEDRTQSGLVIDQQHMADARLIAAAPDLLEALCKLAKLYDAMNAPRGPCRIMADAAIAKATGEQP